MFACISHSVIMFNSQKGTGVKKILDKKIEGTWRNRLKYSVFSYDQGLYFLFMIGLPDVDT